MPGGGARAAPAQASDEAYIGAKMMVEAMRRAGKNLAREGFMRELDAMKDFHTGGSFAELTVIGREQTFRLLI